MRNRFPWAARASVGPPNPLGAQFLADLQNDYSAHGAETIAGIRKNEPRNYLKLLLSLGPPRALTSEELLDSIDDQELATLLQAARAALAAREEAAGGTEASPESP